MLPAGSTLTENIMFKIISNIHISLSHNNNATMSSGHQKSFYDDFCVLLNYGWNIVQDLEQFLFLATLQ